MTHAIDLMTPSELTRFETDEEAGFGSLATEKGNLPLTAMNIRARAVGLTSFVRLRQTFVNSYDEPIEASYIFPLPSRAAVTAFRMQVGDRIIEGEIKERGEARREYDQAIRTGHRAAITEEERSGVFTMRVGNLMPGDEAVVELTMTGRLAIEEGDATFRFPLVVAPRYIPGEPLDGESVGAGVAADTDAVPDASRITPPVLLPGCPNPVRLQLSLDIDPAGLPISNVRSSLHCVDTEEAGDRHIIELRSGERLNRDFIVRFRLGDDAIRTSLRASKDEQGDEGTFTLTMLPPASDPSAIRPRDLVFVLDRSGSMGGWKMVAARRAVARMVDTLTDADRFAVYAFDNVIETPLDKNGFDLSPATDRNRFRAVEFLAGLEARGGTEMATPLTRATKQLAGGYQERDKVLVLATDGQVGNEDQILRALSTSLKNVRVFTLGIDRAVNEGFLKRFAAIGGGSCSLVESDDRLDDVMDQIHRRIATPVVTEVSLEARGLDIDRDSIVPTRFPDLFEGAPVTISGRFRGGATGSIALKGCDALGRAWECGVPAVEVADKAASKIWAREHIRALEDQYAIRSSSLLAKMITAASLRFGVLCRFTAFLAVDRSERVNPDGDPRGVIQAVEGPDGWDMLADDADMGIPRTMTGALSPQSRAILARGYGAAAGPSAAPAAGRGASPRAMGGAPPPAPAAPQPEMLSRAAAPKSKRRSLAGPIQAASRALKGAFGSRAEKPKPNKKDAGFDATPYNERLARCISRLPSLPDDSSRLSLLAQKLRAVIDDLSSVGAPASFVEPLRKLWTEIREALASALSDAELSELLTRAEKVASEGGQRSSQSRGEFWK